MDLGLAQTITGGLGAGLSLIGQNSENQFNSAQAQTQMDFQRDMSSTAYQRASSDMTKAGLNPLMMYGSGGPASTPTGAMATQTNNAGADAVKAATSSAQAMRESASTESQLSLNNASKIAMRAKAASDWATAKQALSQTKGQDLKNTGWGEFENMIFGPANSAAHAADQIKIGPSAWKRGLSDDPAPNVKFNPNFGR